MSKASMVPEAAQSLESAWNVIREVEVELEVMTRLQRISSVFLADRESLQRSLLEVVDAAVAICDSDFGNIQLIDPRSGDLHIVAQRGFEPWWLDFWNRVSAGQGSCGTALEQGTRVIVEDIERSPIFVGTPALEIQRRAGVRAVVSTPLVSRSGKPLGMFSTHYRTPRQPDAKALALLDILARQAGDIIERARLDRELEKRVTELTAQLSAANAELDAYRKLEPSQHLDAPAR